MTCGSVSTCDTADGQLPTSDDIVCGCVKMAGKRRLDRVYRRVRRSRLWVVVWMNYQWREVS